MENQTTAETFEFDCCVRGYHLTENQWKDFAIAESLTLCHQETIKCNPCAMAIYREYGRDNDKINVGHITIVLSSTLRFFVKHGGKISVKVSQKNYRASNLEQGGLEVPFHCVLCDFLPGRTTHEKTETNAGGILAFQTRVSITKQERKRVNNATRTRIHCCAATIRWFFSFSFLNVY